MVHLPYVVTMSETFIPCRDAHSSLWWMLAADAEPGPGWRREDVLCGEMSLTTCRRMEITIRYQGHTMCIFSQNPNFFCPLAFCQWMASIWFGMDVDTWKCEFPASKAELWPLNWVFGVQYTKSCNLVADSSFLTETSRVPLEKLPEVILVTSKVRHFELRPPN